MPTRNKAQLNMPETAEGLLGIGTSNTLPQQQHEGVTGQFMSDREEGTRLDAEHGGAGDEGNDEREADGNEMGEHLDEEEAAAALELQQHREAEGALAAGAAATDEAERKTVEEAKKIKYTSNEQRFTVT